MNANISKKEGNLLEFPQVNILEQGIAQVNCSLKEKKEFFLKNLRKKKIKVFFTDKKGLKKIEAKIWTITEKALILKESKVIPLARIVAVA